MLSYTKLLIWNSSEKITKELNFEDNTSSESANDPWASVKYFDKIKNLFFSTVIRSNPKKVDQ